MEQMSKISDEKNKQIWYKLVNHEDVYPREDYNFYSMAFFGCWFCFRFFLFFASKIQMQSTA